MPQHGHLSVSNRTSYLVLTKSVFFKGLQGPSPHIPSQLTFLSTRTQKPEGLLRLQLTQISPDYLSPIFPKSKGNI